MAKKNKKFTKINQKIKKYFSDESFDVGIEQVDGKTLSELMHYLGIYDTEFAKKNMLKAARHIWSSGGLEAREQILDFFIQNQTIYKSDKSNEPLANKEEKIRQFLEKLDADKEEREKLFSFFKEYKTKKITFSKVKNKLNEIRFEEKRTTIENTLEGSFTKEHKFEFFHLLEYEIFGEKFQKMLQLQTQPYSFGYLLETPLEELIETVEADKTATVQNKQKELKRFLQTLPNPHPYLQNAQMLHALKSSPPHTYLTHTPLPHAVLKEILQKDTEIQKITIEQKTLTLAAAESITLPVTNQKYDYTLEVVLELEELWQNIWLAKPLHLQEAFQTAKTNTQEIFRSTLDEIVSTCKEHAKTLNLSQEALYKLVYESMLPYLSSTLTLSGKFVKKTIRRFLFLTQELVIQKQKEQLLAQTIRDFKNLFPLARAMRRKITLHIGPTNSGKTYAAMEKLKKADTGYYLAPLRLLALEGYEELQKSGIATSLVTGEEQLLDEEATHISSTIEMLNYDIDVDVCVIDEVQLIDDKDRGWAWANAIIGAPAKEVILTGSANAKEMIVSLAEYLGEELEIIEHKRKSPLKLLEKPTPFGKIEKASAIIAFSRKEVLRLKQKLSKEFSTSIIYGNLSPEVRREEAKRFREGKSDILIATDAISMGLNLPIKTILFSKAKKFDGVLERELFPQEIKQIAGRAGRYGIHEQGFVGGIDEHTHKIIARKLYLQDNTITPPAKVMANMGHIRLISSILETTSLEQTLLFFSSNMTFSGPFETAHLEDMIAIAKITDKYRLDITEKFHLSSAPLTLGSAYILGVFESYLTQLEKKEPIIYAPPKLFGSYAQTSQDLLQAEDYVKEISLYLWLSYRFEEYFIDQNKAKEYRSVLNTYIENSLQQTRFAFRCRMCDAILPPNTKHKICNRCYKKHYKRKYRNITK